MRRLRKSYYDDHNIITVKDTGASKTLLKNAIFFIMSKITFLGGNMLAKNFDARFELLK